MAAGDESVEEADRNCGDKAEQEAENGDRDPDRRRQGIHLRQLHRRGGAAVKTRG